jgi:hypothetical protein
MVYKIRCSTVCGLQLESIYLLAVAAVLVIGTDMGVQVATVKYDSGSDKAGVKERQHFSKASDMRRYSQASTASSGKEANVAVMGNQSIESDRKPSANTALIDFWGTLYNSTERVLQNCYYEYSSGTIQYESEKIFVKCLEQAAFREMKSILNYNGSSGRSEPQENGDYRVGKMDQLTDIDRMPRRVNLRVKLMSGLFLWLSQREDSLRVGVELDERDTARLEGELSQH